MNTSSRHIIKILLLCCISTLQISCSRPGITADTLPILQENADTIDFSALSAGHDYVDLGICQGLCWATMNIGADCPEERGAHFCWGETMINKEPHYDPKFYPFGHPSHKYVARNNNGFYEEEWAAVAVDGRTVLEACDDAAHVNWGGSWRMPFADELDSLITLCRWGTRHAQWRSRLSCLEQPERIRRPIHLPPLHRSMESAQPGQTKHGCISMV